MVICNRLLGVAFHPKESYFSILNSHSPFFSQSLLREALNSTLHPSRFVGRIYDIASTVCMELM